MFFRCSFHTSIHCGVCIGIWATMWQMFKRIFWYLFVIFLIGWPQPKRVLKNNEKNRGIETSICVDSSTWAKGSLLCFLKIILKYDSYNERKSNNHKELQTDSHSVVCVYCCISCHSINSFRIFTNLKVTCFYFVLLFYRLLFLRIGYSFNVNLWKQCNFTFFTIVFFYENS